MSHLFAIVATAALTAHAQPQALVQSKVTPVEKVITMLGDLRASVQKEGDEESWTYNKFACFCKDTQAEKTAAITAGEDKRGQLSGEIESLSSHRSELDEKIAGLLKDIKEAEDDMAKSAAARKATLGVYTKDAEDLSGGLDGLRAAIDSLKGSKASSLLQIHTMAKTVRRALAIADALGLAGATKASNAITVLLQQNPDVPMQDYDFHSDGIIETLEKLLADFTATKNQIDSKEVKSVQEHDMFMQGKTDFVKVSNHHLEAARKEKEETTEAIATAQQELSTTAAVLLDDKQYLTELVDMCNKRATTYDQRVECRKGELTALTQAMQILEGEVTDRTTDATVRLNQQGVDIRFASIVARSPASMEAIEEEAEEVDGDGSFLQVASQSNRFLAAQPSSMTAQRAAADLLSSQGMKIKTTLLIKLASTIATDPFAKVKKLIQELIERLLTEAANEANQKGWCDKATADAEQKRDYAVEEIRTLNADMASLEARRDQLNEEIDELQNEIAEIEAAQQKANDFRKAEHDQNADTVDDATHGLSAINDAIEVMERFYKTNAKNKVDLTLAQGPADDAPDAGFKAGEAYKGGQGAATGIIGMMDVIRTDFSRTISETKQAEAKAKQAHHEFLTETSKSLAEKTEAKKEKEVQRDDAVEKLASARESLKLQTDVLMESIKELQDLKPACVDTGMSYQERVARREQEIQSLKQADCILVHFAEFGPDGAAEAC